MGKLMDELQAQSKNPNYKKNAEDCIKIYNWIKETDPDGRVWESRWNSLVNVKWKGEYPNNIPIYSLNITGYTLLKGIECNE